MMSLKMEFALLSRFCIGFFKICLYVLYIKHKTCSQYVLMRWTMEEWRSLGFEKFLPEKITLYVTSLEYSQDIDHRL